MSNHHTLKFYTNNLIPLNFGEDYMPLNLPIFNLANNYMDGIFFRALYLKNKNVLSAFVTNNNYELGFILVKIDYNYGGGITNAHSSDLYIDNLEEFLSDFIKVNEKRAIFICVYIFNPRLLLRNLQATTTLKIIIIDISPDYSSFVINQHSVRNLNLQGYIPIKQISTYLNNQNNFPQKLVLRRNEQRDYLSMFMIFSYANGTDATINISDYFTKDGDDINNPNPFFELLYDKFTNENNIFNYYKDPCIKLVSIPKEIKITKYDGKEIPLSNDSDICISDMFTIKENKKLKKTSQYYHIDYQFSVSDSNPDASRRRMENDDSEVKLRNLRSPYEAQTNNIYYGRTNRVKFKLCHEYCESCYELSYNNSDQKCESCLRHKSK